MRQDVERVYFKGDMKPGTWREVPAGINTIERDGFIWRRYLFQNGDRKLVVFSPNAWAKYDEVGIEQKAYFPGWPDGHHKVWLSLVYFDPAILADELGIDDPESELMVGNDSGPIGCLSDKFNSAGSVPWPIPRPPEA